MEQRNFKPFGSISSLTLGGGGIGNVWGPIIGASILIPISEYSRIYLGGTGGAVDLILYGLILMIICIFRPDGLISFVPKDILNRKKQR